jgi:NADH-quinone oxidoreductase subunit C
VTLEEIHARLSEQFGDAVAPWAPPEHGDAWIEVRPDTWRQAAEYLRNDEALRMDFFRLLSGVDYSDWLEAVYHLFSYTHEHEVVIKVKVDRSDPKIASVADLWPAADWHEREAYDMVGLVFEGHPNLTRILLPEDWEGFPLRKDYKQPDEYHGVSNW